MLPLFSSFYSEYEAQGVITQKSNGVLRSSDLTMHLCSLVRKVTCLPVHSTFLLHVTHVFGLLAI